MVFNIGSINMSPYVARGGFQWQRADVDGEGAGRDLGGTLHRNRIASKRRLDITCRPLTSDEANVVLNAISPETVSVNYYDPQEGRVVTKIMYSNNNPATYLMMRPDGKELWSGITFPLIEV